MDTDAERVSRALATRYAESGKRLTNVTSKHASLKQYLHYDCNVPEENMKSLETFIFKSTSSVEDKNDVVWTKAMYDTPIEYVIHLARTYHGFAEDTRKCEYFYFTILHIQKKQYSIDISKHLPRFYTLFISFSFVTLPLSRTPLCAYVYTSFISFFYRSQEVFQGLHPVWYEQKTFRNL